MAARFFVLFLLSFATCEACDCREPSVPYKLQHADVVFRGTIIDLQPSYIVRPAREWIFYRDLHKTVVFKVRRVWKGQVGEKFQMPAFAEIAACDGFESDLLKVGKDLLVYAFRREEGYITAICGQHKVARDAGKDFRELGPGHAPHPSK